MKWETQHNNGDHINVPAIVGNRGVSILGGCFMYSCYDSEVSQRLLSGLESWWGDVPRCPEGHLGPGIAPWLVGTLWDVPRCPEDS